MKRRKKILTFLTLFVLFLCTVTQVNASSFKDSYYGDSKTILFNDTDDGVSATKDTYPFNEKDASIKSVGFDVIFGMTKQLVRYKGEIPYKETRDADSGTPISGLGNIPFRENTSIKDDDNPSYIYKGKLVKNTTVEDYWGSGVKTAESEVSRATLEKINDDGIKSLRLYAAQKSTGSISFIAYALSGIIWLGTQIISLVLMIKNISMSTLLDALHIESLNKTMNEVFVGTGGTISPIALFCIISLLLVIVSYVVRFLKGTETLKSLFTNVVAIALVGLLLIGTSLTGKVGTLANVGSNFVNNVLISVNPAMLTTDGLFLTETTGGDSSKDLLTQELSMINKINIDVQICTQFGVNSMKELDFEAFGDTDGKIAKDTLSGLSDPKQVAGNLGYYFWYANSGASSLDRTKVPKISNTQEEKLGSMITYLQKMYNANEKNPEIQEKIKQILLSIASPSGLSGVVYALMLIAIFTLLALSLWRFCIACAASKIEFAIALLALPVAGLLMFSGRKKMVDTGKGILGVFFTALLKVILYSAIFDLILYIVSAVLSVSFIGFILVLILVFFFYKSRRMFEDHINNMIKSIERTYAPQAVQMKQQMKSSINRAMNRKANEAASKKKLIGYDENGNPIYKETGKLQKAIFRTAADATSSSATSRHGLSKITSDAKNEIEKSNRDATDRLTTAEHNKAKSKVAATLQDMNDKTKEKLESMKDENGDYLDDKLTTKEQAVNDKIKHSLEEAEKITNSGEYKKLMAKENLSNKETDKLTTMHKAIERNEAKAREAKQELDKVVSERVFMATQNENAEALKEALTQEIAAAEDKAMKHSVKSAKELESIIQHKKALQAVKQGRRVDDVKVTLDDKNAVTEMLEKRQYDSTLTDKAAGIIRLNMENKDDK